MTASLCVRVDLFKGAFRTPREHRGAYGSHGRACLSCILRSMYTGPYVVGMLYTCRDMYDETSKKGGGERRPRPFVQGPDKGSGEQQRLRLTSGLRVACMARE
ncbi:unnamed protein product [Ectocarpus sp. 13 AM-2016]